MVPLKKVFRSAVLIFTVAAVVLLGFTYFRGIFGDRGVFLIARVETSTPLDLVDIRNRIDADDSDHEDTNIIDNSEIRWLFKPLTRYTEEPTSQTSPHLDHSSTEADPARGENATDTVVLKTDGPRVEEGVYKWHQIAMEMNLADADLHAMYRGNLGLRYPGAVVIGSGKCGTGAMRYFLSEHPFIQAMTNGPEPDMFKGSFSSGTKRRYLTMMPYSLENQVTIEKTPMYVGYKTAPELIKQAFPNMKLILIVRDPVKRTISDFVQQISNRVRAHKPAPWKITDFHKIVFTPKGDAVNGEKGIVKSGLFDVLIDKWLATFPRNQIHIVDGEEMISNTSLAMRRIETFLDVPHFYKEEHFYYNASRHLVCITVPAPHCLPKSKGREHPNVTDEELTIMYDFFRPHVHRFFEKTGLDFKWPGY